MTIEVDIIADSVAPHGGRITTFKLRYPRFIHAELMTHRVFSRNASSSRAVPVKKELEKIRKDTARPLKFGKNQKGMQSFDFLEGKEAREALEIWESACADAMLHAEKLANIGVHKQYVNRILEPFQHIDVLVSSTDYNNWWGLRYHPMAMPEIAELAKLMHTKYLSNNPVALKAGDWHVPFVNETQPLADALVRSVARCARVSYRNHEGKETTLEEDKKLYNRLLSAQPIHASPAEHQAMAVTDPNINSGNFKGWIQFRKGLVGENITEFSPGMYKSR